MSKKNFATLLTPSQYADGDPDMRWDTARICDMNEILGFYGLPYWYTWQVSILGLGRSGWEQMKMQRKKLQNFSKREPFSRLVFLKKPTAQISILQT
ncbi:MAG: hypothetical protein R2941_16920 [Desulfobacterales bacterium]